MKKFNELTPAEIQQYTQAGTIASMYSIGDETCEITLNGQVGDGLTLSNFKCTAFVIGFDHNQSLESPGRHVTHLQLGKKGGKLIAFCDSYYEQWVAYKEDIPSGAIYEPDYFAAVGNYFTCLHCTVHADPYGYINQIDSEDYSGGWNANRIRSKILASGTAPNSAPSKTFPTVFPTAWKNVMTYVTKYSDNVAANYGKSTASDITATTEYVTLASVYEYEGPEELWGEAYHPIYEYTKQQQYQYYANGNSDQHYKHSSTSWEVETYTRSVHSGGHTAGKNKPEGFICVPNTYGSISYALSPIFFIG